jgi:hypothetical protein
MSLYRRMRIRILSKLVKDRYYARLNLDCDKAEKQGNRCLGFSKVNDDEPIETCKQCKKCTIYGEE